jgi:hypothetical protein
MDPSEIIKIYDSSPPRVVRFSFSGAFREIAKILLELLGLFFIVLSLSVLIGNSAPDFEFSSNAAYWATLFFGVLLGFWTLWAMLKEYLFCVYGSAALGVVDSYADSLLASSSGSHNSYHVKYLRGGKECAGKIPWRGWWVAKLKAGQSCVVVWLPKLPFVVGLYESDCNTFFRFSDTIE